MLVCADICATARDGVCDDGGDLAQRGPPPIGTHIFAKEAAHSLIQLEKRKGTCCAYGTDCKDCRAAMPPATRPRWLPAFTAANLAEISSSSEQQRRR